MLLGLENREAIRAISPALESELDHLCATMSATFEVEHDDQGHHTNIHALSINQTITNPQDTPPAATTVGPISQEGSGHQWLMGPWLFDQSNAGSDIAGLRVAEAGGTYNNYAPAGIDNALIVEIAPVTAMTITGLRQFNRVKRLLIIGNRGNSGVYITLKQNNAGSIVTNRFGLPGDTDVVLDTGQFAWLYYDVGSNIWRCFITPMHSGGLAGNVGSNFVVGPGSAVDNDIAVFDGTTGKLIKDSGTTVASLIAAGSSWTIATTSIGKTALEALLTPVIVVPAPAAGSVNIVASITVAVTQSAAYAGGSTWHLRYTGSGAVEIISAFSNDLGLNRNKLFSKYATDFGVFAGNVTALNGASIEFSADANPTGAGNASAIVTVVYRTVACPA